MWFIPQGSIYVNGLLRQSLRKHNRLVEWKGGISPVMETNYKYLIFRDLPESRHYRLIASRCVI